MRNSLFCGSVFIGLFVPTAAALPLGAPADDDDAGLMAVDEAPAVSSSEARRARYLAAWIADAKAKQLTRDADLAAAVRAWEEFHGQVGRTAGVLFLLCLIV